MGDIIPYRKVEVMQQADEVRILLIKEATMSVDDFVPEGGVEEVDLGVDLDTIPAQHAVPSGEYLLTLADVSIDKQKPEKGEGKYIKATFEVANDSDAKLINEFMMLPKEGDPERRSKNRLRRIGDFYKTFKIPSTGPVRLTNYVGNQGYAALSVETDEKYGDQNRISRFIPQK